MPLYGESVLNFILKVIFGVLIFWLLYYPLYGEEMAFLTQVSYIMLFSLAASFTALFLRYFFLLIITKMLKRPKKGIFEVNHYPDMGSILYEFLAVTLNALFMASGLLLFLNAQTATWEQFLLLYFAMKILSRLVAYAVSVMIGKNTLFTIAFLVMFFFLILAALIELTGVSFFEK